MFENHMNHILWTSNDVLAEIVQRPALDTPSPGGSPEGHQRVSWGGGLLAISAEEYLEEYLSLRSILIIRSILRCQNSLSPLFCDLGLSTNFVNSSPNKKKELKTFFTFSRN